MCEEFEREQTLPQSFSDTECSTNESDEVVKLLQINLENTVVARIGSVATRIITGYTGNPYIYGLTGDSYNPALNGHDL